MVYRRIVALTLLLATASSGHSQLLKNILNTKPSAPNNDALIQGIKTDIQELSNDKYTGRAIGTNGYNNVTAHIEKRMSESGLVRYGTVGYKSSYKYATGRSATVEAKFLVSNKNLIVNTDVIPLSFCANEENNAYLIPNVPAAYSAWLVPLFTPQQANRPAEDWLDKLDKVILNAQERGATALYLYDNSANGLDLKNIKNSNIPIHRDITIPVWIISKKAYNDHFKDVNYLVPVYSNTKFRNDYKDGYNLAGTINNGAASTIVIMADYDQLYQSDKGEILNGANDNASGIATLFQLVPLLRTPEYKQYNYAFVAFSGSQMGNLGAQSFLNIPDIKSKIAYAIDITAVGKLDSDQRIYLNGVASALMFKNAIKDASKDYQPRLGQEYPHASSYTSFLKEGIPTLSFSTGYNQYFNAETDKITGINFAGLATVTRYIAGVIASVNKSGLPKYNNNDIAISDKDLVVEKIVAAAPPPKVTTKPAQKPASKPTPAVVSNGAPVNPGKPKTNNPALVNKKTSFDSTYAGGTAIVIDFLGLGVNELDSREGGAYIYSLEGQGKGATLGFKEGDVVLQIGSFPVFNAKSYLLTLRKFKTGERAYFKVKKPDGKTEMINVAF
ncbi:hypothetical protein DBR32_02045 [Taibaiella sp. KBW10]|uniref:M28 family peptidase n=1 Tax=Taibaiella sp. KBW10 TaxID=2153357 RepID=UPI000F98F4C5|nr:M28 family peptidase [Taibaiella sp. KBW10]RQO32410.1 hypothetical protein DBR32_02045 [Taibaiella sp. KBW10]